MDAPSGGEAAHLRSVLDRLGDPADIVAAALWAVPHWSWREKLLATLVAPTGPFGVLLTRARRRPI